MHFTPCKMFPNSLLSVSVLASYILVFSAFGIANVHSSDEPIKAFNKSICTDSLSPELRAEIRSYKTIVDEIMMEATQGAFKSKLYSDLAYFVDTYGARISGSDALQKSAEYLSYKMEEIGMSNVHGEKSMLPKWVRGEEKAVMLTPRMKELELLGLGQTIPTPPEGLFGEVVAVENYSALKQMSNAERLHGKIILFNDPSPQGGIYQLIGAILASKVGGIAALVRSPTIFSLNTPHTGIQFYDENITARIPAAMLSQEDADLLYRLYQRGEQVTVNLSLSSTTYPDVEGWNLIGDFEGRELPDEYVAVGAHYDSWDVGQGAIDDGVGVILGLNVVNTLKKLRFQPRRTIRNLLFTGEELGLLGASSWTKDHSNEFSKYSAALEADYGCLSPSGLVYTGSPMAGCILHEIMEAYFAEQYNITSLIYLDDLYTDVHALSKQGVPAIVLNGDDGKYFFYHHSQADTMSALKMEKLDLCLGFWTATTYVIADLKDKLPR